MRRRVIDTTEEMLEVISRCDVCYVSMVTPEGLPYVVPMNFGFSDGVL
ncbi:MAG: MFS transporter, partial [Bacteroidetes bacterium HGW-Bacteroidetes-22]